MPGVWAACGAGAVENGVTEVQDWVSSWVGRVEGQVIDFLSDAQLVRSAFFADPPVKGLMWSWTEFSISVDELFLMYDQLDQIRGVVRSDVRQALVDLAQALKAFAPRAENVYADGNDKAMVDDPAWERITADAQRLKVLIAKRGWWIERRG